MSDSPSVIPLSEARRRAKRATPPPPPSPEVAPDVTCLGHNKGRYFFAPRGTGQVSVFTSRELSSLGTLIELAPLEYWEREFPGPKGANIMAAANALVRTCQQMGIFDERRFRGRGACWDAGRLVLHLGDRLIADSQSVPVGEFDSHFIYESMASLGIDPAAPALTATEGGRFVDFCRELRWERPFMGTLLAGWVATAPIAGALPHRPHAWLTGQSGSGKSWLVSTVKLCLGKILIDFQSTSTEAAVRQTLAADALPVVFDEAEGDTKAARERRQQIIEYARASSSEDAPPIRKGGHNGRPVEYYPRSPFFYSSINLGLQGEADERRTTVLRLLGREDGGEAATLARLDHFERLKRHRAEVITPDFPARLLARAARNCAVTRKNADIYTRAAAETLGSMGAAVQIGTLLAGAASLHHARIVTLEEARVFIAREGWVSEASGSQDAGLSDHEQLFKLICDSMTTVRLGNATGYDRTFGDLIVNMAMLKTDEQIPRDCADEHLRRSGLMVARGSEGRGGDLEQWYCWIANQHYSLERMLANTRWGGRWADSLRRVPGAVRGLRPLRFGNSAKVRAVGVPVAAIGEM